ncbi:serine/threonine protein kinase [Rubripirellula amarantea]|uniref:Serine/threonine-protein kinase PknB n=1 Tax=Rubripirellula amarantea TaxID=2527999 RepID=A0A5C5WWS3_9BACT|nr:serine/threonine-protein kinase [Rubripirellula amarantea]MDA8743720.1 serine/threonine protein kinase [Rubripirellula amarantea]TWT54591.1 Serine/threonine-protein kinase PknB [Rubripirellula amarantea]
MTQPSSSTVLTFAEAAVRSGLVSERKYARAVEHAGTDNDTVVAETLVMSGIITKYQAEQLRQGRTKLSLGPYLITDFIGQGGMGRVFKAVHRVMGRECAVKVLPLEKSTAESRGSFMREIRTQAGLDNPYVVRAFDAGQDGKIHYLVTEYVPGTDLRQMVRNRLRDGLGPLTMEEAAVVISQSALGLQYAHDLGLIHRDIKPGNILVTPDGHAKLSDIGLAAWSMGLQDDPMAGKIVGTADYLSPEQVRDPRSVGPASDIYSLGCTLYYTVTGKVPFPGGDSRSKCRRHCEETPWHPRNLASDLTEDFVDVIADMMEKDPARRIPSAAEVAERLEPWANAGMAPIAPATDLSEQRQSWTPPPPPNEPSQLREPREIIDASGSGAVNGETEAALHEWSESSYPSGIGLQTSSRPSHTVAIAIALSIAVPLSLLAGAIVGFLVRGRI